MFFNSITRNALLTHKRLLAVAVFRPNSVPARAQSRFPVVVETREPILRLEISLF